MPITVKIFLSMFNYLTRKSENIREIDNIWNNTVVNKQIPQQNEYIDQTILGQNQNKI